MIHLCSSKLLEKIAHSNIKLQVQILDTLPVDDFATSLCASRGNLVGVGRPIILPLVLRLASKMLRV